MATLPFLFLLMAGKTISFRFFILLFLLKTTLHPYHTVKTAVPDLLKLESFCLALTDEEWLVFETESFALSAGKIYLRLIYLVTVTQEDCYHQ